MKNFSSSELSDLLNIRVPDNVAGNVLATLFNDLM
ncbi:MAG: hypothetical protein JWP81_1067 [Ferruginibacter sp.]|nr:hypothetical protein [Ferruginibacter sp.]